MKRKQSAAGNQDSSLVTRHSSQGCTAEIEKALWEEGFKQVAGVDEVGRGAWAGPVVAAVVVFAPDRFPPGLNDSKKLTPDERNTLNDLILSHASAFAIAEQPAQVIDRINILEATKLAMRKAIDELSSRPDYVLIDALTLKGLEIPQRGIIRGDAQSVSIAAASIIAKVYRDRLMTAFDEEFPGYGLARHKGYGTAEHRRALAELGPCPIHRLTFRGVLPEEKPLQDCLFQL